MAKFGINDILNAKTKAAGQQAQGYKDYMVTIDEFMPMLNQLYDNGGSVAKFQY